MTSNMVLWIYIVLLLVGGLMGYLKAGSKVSLVLSVAFAVLLGLCAAQVIRVPYLAEALLMALLIVFVVRFVKTRKLMPAGLMLLLTALALVLRYAVG